MESECRVGEEVIFDTTLNQQYYFLVKERSYRFHIKISFANPLMSGKAWNSDLEEIK